jgi:hypothetical protein
LHSSDTGEAALKTQDADRHVALFVAGCAAVTIAAMTPRQKPSDLRACDLSHYVPGLVIRNAPKAL